MWWRKGRASQYSAQSTGGRAWILVAAIATLFVGSLAGCAIGGTANGQLTTNAAATPTFTHVPFVQPHVGDPESTFVAAYGQPFQHLPEEVVYYTDKAQTVSLGVHYVNGVGVHLYASGPIEWGYQGAFAECTLFLPPDAKVYSTPAAVPTPITVYTSSIGQISLKDNGQGGCEVYLAGS